jgi:hypothetical protein
VFLLSACNQAFDLRPTVAAPPADAIDAVLDSDGDGVIDLDDNCRMVANQNQHDEDHDGLGDVCDNCPLVENNAQADAGDHDGIGDVCDPHPTDSGDCLKLFDSFLDPLTFAQHWRPFRQIPDTPGLEATVDRIRITPHQNYPGGFVALDTAGADLVGTFSVQLSGAAVFMVPMVQIGAVSNGVDNTPTTSGYLCALYQGKQVKMTQTGTGPLSEMSASAVGSQFLLRLVPPEKPGNATCRVDYGLAVGTAFVGVTTVSTPGVVGAIAQLGPNDIEAIAIYDVQTSCAPAIIR